MPASIEDMVLKGYGRALTVGAFSTPVLPQGATAVIDLDRPQFAIAVPANYAIRLTRVEVVVQGGISTADSDETELLMAVDSLGQWTGDGTFVSEIPSNMRTDLDKGSACRCGSDFSADMTTTPGNGVAAADPVLDMELLRVVETADSQTAAGAIYRNIKGVYEPKYPPYIVGPATVLGYWGGTIANVGGFADVQWVEAPAALILPAVAGL